MVWVGRDLEDHLVPSPLPWTETPSTRPGCSKPHSTWPWTLPGREHPQLLWATCLWAPEELVTEEMKVMCTNLGIGRAENGTRGQIPISGPHPLPHCLLPSNFLLKFLINSLCCYFISCLEKAFSARTESSTCERLIWSYNYCCNEKISFSPWPGTPWDYIRVTREMRKTWVFFAHSPFFYFSGWGVGGLMI